jgi:O-antigen/teichoic acid export membrane protein
MAAGLGFLVNVFLARELDLANYGKISLVFSFVIMMSTISDFGFGNSVVIFYNKFVTKTRGYPLNLVNSVYSIFLSCLLCCCTISLLIFYNIKWLSYEQCLVILSSSLFFTISRYICSVNQALGNWYGFNTLNIANNIFKLLCVLFGFFVLSRIFSSNSKYSGVLFGYSIYPILLFLFSLYLTRNNLGKFSFEDKRFLKKLLNVVFPIGITNVIIIISMRFDVLVVDKFLGSEALGIYSAANSLALAFPLVTKSIMNVLLKESSSQNIGFLEKILERQKKYIKHLMLVLCLSILFAGYVIDIVFGSRFSESVGIFRLLIIGYIGGIFFVPLESYFYSHKPKFILIIKFVSMLNMVILSLCLVSSFKLYGVAISSIITRIIGWSIILYSASNKVKESFCEKYLSDRKLF